MQSLIKAFKVLEAFSTEHPERSFTEIVQASGLGRSNTHNILKTLVSVKTTSGEYEPLDGDRLTQFRRYNPYNPWRGLSELAALEDELVVDVNPSRWNLQFFGNQNGVPTGLLKPSADNLVPTQDRDDYLSRFNGRHSRNRAVGILPPGWDFEKIGGSPNDMEFGLLREYAREQTLAMFGVPPFLAGVLDTANYANAREQKGVYWNGTITRMLEYFQGSSITTSCRRTASRGSRFIPATRR